MDYRESQPTYYANTAMFSRRLINRRPRRTGKICKYVIISIVDYTKQVKEILDIKNFIYSILETNIKVKIEKIEDIQEKINFANDELESINNTKLPLFKRREKIKEKEEILKQLRVKVNNYIIEKNKEFIDIYSNIEKIDNYYIKYNEEYSDFKLMFLDNSVTEEQIISVVNFLCSNGIIIKNYYENNANSLSEKMIQNIKKEIVESLSINYEDIIYKNIDEEIVENIMMDYENIIVNNLEFSKKIKKI